MPSFFNTLHCSSEVHCSVCRAKQDGRRWRVSICRRWPDTGEPDFECPRGHPWGLKAPTRLANSKRLHNFATVKAEIQQAPDTELFQAVKELLRVTEDMIQLHSWRHTPCWTRRQQDRVIQAWQVAQKKAKDDYRPQ